MNKFIGDFFVELVKLAEDKGVEYPLIEQPKQLKLHMPERFTLKEINSLLQDDVEYEIYYENNNFSLLYNQSNEMTEMCDYMKPEYLILNKKELVKELLEKWKLKEIKEINSLSFDELLKLAEE